MCFGIEFNKYYSLHENSYSGFVFFFLYGENSDALNFTKLSFSLFIVFYLWL